MENLMTWAVLALIVCLTLGVSAETAYVFDRRDLNWEERCTVEALQGLVNREGPKLFLSEGNDDDQRWLDIYAERNGLTYETVDSLQGLLERFARVAEGLVVYDPEVDGSRYVAITLAGVENLLPVYPALLDGAAPALLAAQDWPGGDFTVMKPGDLDSWRRSARETPEPPDSDGLWLVESNPEQGSDWAIISYGPLTIDLNKYPILEASVGALEGEDAVWGIKLTWDRDGDGRVSGGQDDLCPPVEREAGVAQWNMRELSGLSGRQTFARIQLHASGPNARALWRHVRFVSRDGERPAGMTPQPLSELGLEVKRDLRGKFGNSMAAYDWALAKVMPRCNRRLAHSADGRVDGFVAGVCGPMGGYDWQVMSRGFVFNVASEPTKKLSYCPPLVGGSPEQAAMYRRILAALEMPAQINGYGEPEGEWCTLLSDYGHYSIHAYYNWSFHNKVHTPDAPLRQAANFTPENVTVEPDKYYVCFMTSEGDTMKGPLPFFYGSWFDPYRGRAPVNWGVNPLMGTQFAAMLDYYYDTASENDYFFAGCSGAGYCYPDHMKDLQGFCEHTREACESSGIPHVDLWGAAQMETLENYGKWARPTALTSFAGPARMKLLADGTPVAFHELGYWQLDGLKGERWGRVFADDARRKAAVDHVVTRIESIAARTYPPFVILVYGDLHSYSRHAQVYWEIAQALDPERFKPARLDEAMAAFRKWSSERVMIGTESINERLLWASLEGVPTEVPVTLTNGQADAASALLEIDVAGETTITEVQLAPHEVKQIAGVKLPLTGGGTGEASLMLDAGGVRETRDIALATVPCDKEYRKATLTGVWSAQGLRHASGDLIEDDESVWGRAWASPRAGGEWATLVFGPYASVPQGHYLVASRLKLAAVQGVEVPEDETLATLDIFSGGSLGDHEVYDKKDLKPADFAAPGQWQWFTLEGDWPGDPSLLETRVFWHGHAQIVVDRVVAFRVEPGA